MKVMINQERIKEFEPKCRLIIDVYASNTDSVHSINKVKNARAVLKLLTPRAMVDSNMLNMVRRNFNGIKAREWRNINVAGLTICESILQPGYYVLPGEKVVTREEALKIANRLATK